LFTVHYIKPETETQAISGRLTQPATDKKLANKYISAPIHYVCGHKYPSKLSLEIDLLSYNSITLSYQNALSYTSTKEYR